MIVINELSFDRDAPDPYAAVASMEQLARTLLATKPLRADDPIRVHTSLMTRRLTASTQVLNWAYGRLGGDRDLRVFFLKVATAGPYVDEELRSKHPGHRCKCGASDVSFSAVAWAAIYEAIVAGREPSVLFPGREINLTLEVDARRDAITLKNIWHASHVHDLRRKYVPSSKHSRGGRGTFMDLDDVTAQAVLDRGVSDGHCVYAIHAGRYYIFRSDNVAGYHGYPIDGAEIPATVKEQLT